MDKKKIILLILVLIIAVIGTIFFVYSGFNKKTNDQNQSVVEISDDKKDDEKKIKKQNLKLEAEEIKDRIKNIDNDSFQTLELEESKEELDKMSEEEKDEFTRDVLGGNFSVAEGRVREISGSELKVDFYQNSYKWTSDIKINSETKIEIIKMTGETVPGKISEIKKGDRIIIHAIDGRITDDSFTAETVYYF